MYLLKDHLVLVEILASIITVWMCLLWVIIKNLLFAWELEGKEHYSLPILQSVVHHFNWAKNQSSGRITFPLGVLQEGRGFSSLSGFAGIPQLVTAFQISLHLWLYWLLHICLWLNLSLIINGYQWLLLLFKGWSHWNNMELSSYLNISLCRSANMIFKCKVTISRFLRCHSSHCCCSFRVRASPLRMQTGAPDALLSAHYRYADGSLRMQWCVSQKVLLTGTTVSFHPTFVHTYSPQRTNLKKNHPRASSITKVPEVTFSWDMHEKPSSP